MTPISIHEARRLANEAGATRLIILGIDDSGNFTFTTFGRTKAQCRALAKWADDRAPYIGAEIDEATLTEKGMV